MELSNGRVAEQKHASCARWQVQQKFLMMGYQGSGLSGVVNSPVPITQGAELTLGINPLAIFCVLGAGNLGGGLKINIYDDSSKHLLALELF